MKKKYCFNDAKPVSIGKLDYLMRIKKTTPLRNDMAARRNYILRLVWYGTFLLCFLGSVSSLPCWLGGNMALLRRYFCVGCMFIYRLRKKRMVHARHHGDQVKR